MGLWVDVCTGEATMLSSTAETMPSSPFSDVTFYKGRCEFAVDVKRRRSKR